VSAGRCKRHELPRWQDATGARFYDRERGSAAARGYGGAWRKIRNAYLREHPLCAHCLEAGRTTAATEVDHVLPLRQGGTHSRANLQSMCHPCHMAKTQGDGSRG
jgi:5-methylcytosine-specific restriction enzyme A